MAQPISEETLDQNNLELSSARQDKSGTIKTGEKLVAGTVLKKDGDKYVQLADVATDADAILLADIDATAEDKIAPILIGGTVDEEMLTFDTGATLTADDVREVLRDKNIYLKKRGK